MKILSLLLMALFILLSGCNHQNGMSTDTPSRKAAHRKIHHIGLFRDCTQQIGWVDHSAWIKRSASQTGENP
jgi:hypothetical protein